MSSGVDLPDRIAGEAEVSRTSTMDGVAGKDRDLEIDQLANGKPVELERKYRENNYYKKKITDEMNINIAEGFLDLGK